MKDANNLDFQVGDHVNIPCEVVGADAGNGTVTLKSHFPVVQTFAMRKTTIILPAEQVVLQDAITPHILSEAEAARKASEPPVPEQTTEPVKTEELKKEPIQVKL